MFEVRWYCNYFALGTNSPRNDPVYMMTKLILWVYRIVVITVNSKYLHLVVSRVNLKLRFKKSNYLPGSYYTG